MQLWSGPRSRQTWKRAGLVPQPSRERKNFRHQQRRPLPHLTCSHRSPLAPSPQTMMPSRGRPGESRCQSPAALAGPGATHAAWGQGVVTTGLRDSASSCATYCVGPRVCTYSGLELGQEGGAHHDYAVGEGVLGTGCQPRPRAPKSLGTRHTTSAGLHPGLHRGWLGRGRQGI